MGRYASDAMARGVSHVLGAVNPLGPIFGKELKTTARRKRTYVLRVGYLLLLLLVLLAVFSTFRGSTHETAASRQQRLAEMGYAFFSAFGMFCILTLAAIGPMLTATCISSERLGKTLPILLTTPLSTWSIVSGKLSSRLLVAFTLLGLSLPLLAVVRLLGGVELGQMSAAVALAAATVTFTASVGLVFSSLVTRPYSAVLLSYAALLLFYLLLPWAVGTMALDRAGPPPEWAGVLLTTANPIYAMMTLIEPRVGAILGGHPWWLCAATHAALAVVNLILASLILRNRAHAVETADRDALRPTPADARPHSEATPRPSSAAPTARSARTFGTNPILRRELSRPIFPRTWQRRTAVAATIAMLLLTYAMVGPSDLEFASTHRAYAIILHGLLAMSVCVVAGNAVASEKESDTWNILLATPLTGQQVVWGKAMGLMRRFLWPMLLFTAHFGFFCLFDAITLGSFLTAVWIIATFNLPWVATGLWLSTCLRSTTTAALLNLAMPLALYLLVPMLAMLVNDYLLEGRWNPQGWLFLAMPYPYLDAGGCSQPI